MKQSEKEKSLHVVKGHKLKRLGTTELQHVIQVNAKVTSHSERDNEYTILF